jgi:hypothetical protein
MSRWNWGSRRPNEVRLANCTQVAQDRDPASPARAPITSSVPPRTRPQFWSSAVRVRASPDGTSMSGSSGRMARASPALNPVTRATKAPVTPNIAHRTP